MHSSSLEKAGIGV